MKKQIKSFIFILFTTIITSFTFAQEDDLGKNIWEVKTRQGRQFYFTHGTAVWGHEFGFFKHTNDCSVDTFWFTFSSYEDEVKEFTGKNVRFDLVVDGEKFNIELSVLTVNTLSLTHVMMFTNTVLEDELMQALKKAGTVNVKVAGPEAIDKYFDIKEDYFSLTGLEKGRKKAQDICIESMPDQYNKNIDLVKGGAF